MKSHTQLRASIGRMSVILLLLAAIMATPACDTIHTYGGIETDGYYYPDGDGHFYTGHKTHKHKKPKHKPGKKHHGHHRHDGHHDHDD